MPSHTEASGRASASAMPQPAATTSSHPTPDHTSGRPWSVSDFPNGDVALIEEHRAVPHRQFTLHGVNRNHVVTSLRLSGGRTPPRGLRSGQADAWVDQAVDDVHDQV